jgi:FkbM family methyltransferase
MVSEALSLTVCHPCREGYGVDSYMKLSVLRRIAARLPVHWQLKLKRIHFQRRMNQGTFVSDEPEFPLLPKFLRSGDWVIDIGANVGFYTKRFAELVGEEGRVIAFEPVPETFALLTNNLDSCRFSNVTLINAAVSDTAGVVGMTIPTYPDTGQKNYYQAHAVNATDSEFRVFTVNLDALHIPVTVRLIKIDTEGHELSVFKGMRNTLNRDRPILIVETSQSAVWEFLNVLGYAGISLPGSPNIVFHPHELKWEELSNH